MAKKQTKKVVKVKVRTVTRYELTAKADTEEGKALLDHKNNKTRNGVIAQTLKKLGGVTFKELFAGIDKRSFGSESKNLDSIVHWHVRDLQKKGFVKYVEEEVKAA